MCLHLYIFFPLLSFLISESAATLEAESGYAMESPEVSQFRQLILDGLWSKAEAALMRLGVEGEGLWVGLPISPFVWLSILLIFHAASVRMPNFS